MHVLEHGVVVLWDNPTPYKSMDIPIEGDSPRNGENLTYIFATKCNGL